MTNLQNARNMIVKYYNKNQKNKIMHLQTMFHVLTRKARRMTRALCTFG